MPHLATLGGPQLDLPAPASGTTWANSPAVSVPEVADLPPANSVDAAGFTGSYTTLPRPASDALAPPGPTMLPPGSDFQDYPRVSNPYFENFSLFIGLDGSKEPVDLGINSNFGYRMALNWGLPIIEKFGLGFQVGTAFNYSQNAMRILQVVDGTVDRWQSFTTVGVFQRIPEGLRWGVVYDFRYDDSYDKTNTGQWCAQLGLETKNNNEFGFWATVRDHGDTGSIGPFSFSVQPISQWNVYWRHVWNHEIVTRAWVGLASEHGRANILLPVEPQVNHPITFGAELYVPLTNNWAIFGEAHFITPNDTGTVTATLGIAWYPGSARGTATSRFAPLMPVANNTTFALDVR